jgi:hypothetical protein
VNVTGKVGTHIGVEGAVKKVSSDEGAGELRGIEMPLSLWPSSVLSSNGDGLLDSGQPPVTTIVSTASLDLRRDLLMSVEPRKVVEGFSASFAGIAGFDLPESFKNRSIVVTDFRFWCFGEIEVGVVVEAEVGFEVGREVAELTSDGFIDSGKKETPGKETSGKAMSKSNCTGEVNRLDKRDMVGCQKPEVFWTKKQALMYMGADNFIG